MSAVSSGPVGDDARRRGLVDDDAEFDPGRVVRERRAREGGAFDLRRVGRDDECERELLKDCSIARNGTEDVRAARLRRVYHRLRARARRGDSTAADRPSVAADSPTLSVDNVAATSMLVALARAGALSEMWRLLEDMRNVEMCEDLPTPDADAVEVVVRALARARSGVAADKAIALYERHFGTRGDLGAPSEACVQAVLLACARKAPPPKGLFDLKRSVRDDVKAARAHGPRALHAVRDLRQYARADACPVRDADVA